MLNRIMIMLYTLKDLLKIISIRKLRYITKVKHNSC